MEIDMEKFAAFQLKYFTVDEVKALIRELEHKRDVTEAHLRGARLVLAEKEGKNK